MVFRCVVQSEMKGSSDRQRVGRGAVQAEEINRMNIATGSVAGMGNLGAVESPRE